MGSRIWNREIPNERFYRASYLILAAIIALLLGGAIGILSPLIWTVMFGVIAMAVILILRWNELAVTIILAVQLYVDWYLGLEVVSLVMAIAFLVIFFLTRSSRYPWVEPRALWLWAVFLLLSIPPAIRGALTRWDAGFYYPNIIFGALIRFWLGTFVARNVASLRLFFQILAVFGTLIALHTIILAKTGVFLFESSHVAAQLIEASKYELGANSGIYRLGSFFTQPNFSGTFFAMMICVALGLYVDNPSPLKKGLYLVEMFLMVLALLYTYSASAWLATGAGIFVFVILAGRMRYRIQICLIIIVATTILLVGFSTQVGILINHAQDPSELILRNGVWQTALRVIQAFPMTGVGLGHEAYLERAEPYRVAAQYKPFDHPHNSYLELGAEAGLPVLFVFLALLSFALWHALRNWVRADERTRSLLGAGIAVSAVLIVNSWSNQGWTLPPLAALGWMILGAVSSPLLAESQNNEKAQEKSDDVTKHS